MWQTSNLHEVYIKGCRCDTKENSKRAIMKIKGNLLKFLNGLKIEIHLYEKGIKSNRISSWFGECLLSQVIYRPSRAEKLQFMKTEI